MDERTKSRVRFAHDVMKALVQWLYEWDADEVLEALGPGRTVPHDSVNLQKYLDKIFAWETAGGV